MRRATPVFGRLAAAVVLASIPLAAQGIITTIAGADWVFPFTPRPAIDSPLGRVTNLASDRNGNLIVADPDNNRVFRISPDGTLTLIAGNGNGFYNGDNIQARTASLSNPRAVAVDQEGNIFIVESGSNRIRKVAANGIISTVAGTGRGAFSGDGGPANEAELYFPYSIAVDSAGSIYIADGLNARVRRVDRSGVIRTIAGTGVEGYSGDGGPAAAAQIGGASILALDSSGNLYLADEDNRNIRRIDSSSGRISTIAGTGEYLPPTDNVPATRTSLSPPFGIAFDSSGRLYIADGGNHRVRRIAADGIISTIAGSTRGYSGDNGTALQALFNQPSAIALDSSNNIYVSDFFNSRLRKIDASGRISAFAGNGAYRFGGDSGPASSALLNEPREIAVDRQGNLYFTDFQAHRVRRIRASDGVISTIAGTGIPGLSGDGGPATAARLDSPFGIAVDAGGNIYIADQGNDRIRKVAPDGVITTVIASTQQERIQSPAFLALDSTGSLYFTEGFRIRKLTGTTLTTVAGNDAYAETRSPDGSRATSVPLAYLFGLVVDAGGSVYFGEQYATPSVRRVSRDGILTTVAGPGQGDILADGGPAIAAAVSPNSLSIDSAGNIYITGRGRVRRFNPGGAIQTVAGGGDPADGDGDGASALRARLRQPASAAVDAGGNLYIVETEGHRIRKVLNLQPPFRLAPESLSFTAKSGGAPPADQLATLTADIPNLPFTVETSTEGNWLTVTPQLGVMPATLQVGVDPSALSPGVYEGRVTVNAPNAVPPTRVLNVRFTVNPADSPLLAAEPLSISFAALQGPNSLMQSLRLLNNGSGEIPYSAALRTTSGGNWLSVSNSEGRLAAGRPANIIVTANPSNLDPGTYSGLITVSSTTGNQELFVPVSLAVNSRTQTIVLGDYGLNFSGVPGAVIPPQTFEIINGGAGVMNWSISLETLSGGNWLEVSPTSGASFAGGEDTPQVEVRVRTAGLSPGDYYGRIQIDAPGAANSPQTLSVVLQVLSPDVAVAPDITPTGLLFVANPGQIPPQSVLVSNLGSSAATYRSSRTYSGPAFFTHRPAEARVSSQEPVVLQVFPDAARLPAGVQRGRITLDFGTATRIVEVVLVVPPPAGAAAAKDPTGSARAAQASPRLACSPSSLEMVLTLLGQQFSVRAGAPVPVEVKVADNCGNFLTNGAVTATFSNSDPPLNLVALNSGRWSGTWQPGRRDTQVRVTITAENAGRTLRGTTQTSGSINLSSLAPTVAPGAILNAASYALRSPIAPGSLISIFGERLAEYEQGSAPPLPSQLAEALVVLGGYPLPLLYATPNQINALVPYELSFNTTHQLVVRRGRLLALPEAIAVAPAQPAVFTVNQLGTGQGLVFRTDNQLASTDSPAEPGETVVIYCAGLGAVNPPVSAGLASPGSPPSSVAQPVSLMIGGREAQVAFAGLTPGFAGLYQINAVIPDGVERGPSVPLTITVAGQTSLPAALAIR